MQQHAPLNPSGGVCAGGGLLMIHHPVHVSSLQWRDQNRVLRRPIRSGAGSGAPTSGPPWSNGQQAPSETETSPGVKRRTPRIGSPSLTCSPSYLGRDTRPALSPPTTFVPGCPAHPPSLAPTLMRAWHQPAAS